MLVLVRELNRPSSNAEAVLQRCHGTETRFHGAIRGHQEVRQLPLEQGCLTRLPLKSPI
jgi:hypothetical protein